MTQSSQEYHINLSNWLFTIMILVIFEPKNATTCRQVSDDQKKAHEDPSNADLIEYGDKILYYDGQKTWHVTIVDNQIAYEPINIENIRLSETRFRRYMNKNDHYQCIKIDKHKLCATTVILQGCPYKKHQNNESSIRDFRNCKELIPIVFIDGETQSFPIGLQLKCFSSTHPNYKKPLNEFIGMHKSIDRNTAQTKLSIALSSIVSKNVYTEICEYNLHIDILDRLKSNHAILHIPFENRYWKTVHKAKLQWNPSIAFAVMPDNKKSIHSLSNENYTAYTKTSFTSIEGSNIDMYIFSTSNKIKALMVGKDVDYEMDLWCGFLYEIVKMTMLDNKYLLVSTTLNFYALPMPWSFCSEKRSCQECNSINYCFWFEDFCVGIDKLNETINSDTSLLKPCAIDENKLNSDIKDFRKNVDEKFDNLTQYLNRLEILVNESSKEVKSNVSENKRIFSEMQKNLSSKIDNSIQELKESKQLNITTELRISEETQINFDWKNIIIAILVIIIIILCVSIYILKYRRNPEIRRGPENLPSNHTPLLLPPSVLNNAEKPAVTTDSLSITTTSSCMDNHRTMQEEKDDDEKSTKNYEAELLDLDESDNQPSTSQVYNIPISTSNEVLEPLKPSLIDGAAKCHNSTDEKKAVEFSDVNEMERQKPMS